MIRAERSCYHRTCGPAALADLAELEAFRKIVNSACHDNTPPDTAEMTQACGEIQYLVKAYLER